ncbi:MAG: vanomycin resistance protein VanB [Chloroflexaceae bacterium]|nr:vanomycin resistance protein VanB [Chloroflexaceae bacterium]
MLMLVALVATTGMLVLLFGERSYAGLIYPNVKVRGHHIGITTPASAHDSLQQRYHAFLANPVEIVYADRVWHPTAADLGLTIAFDEAVEQAVYLGRTNTRQENVRTVLAVWQAGVELPMRVTIDQQQLQRYLLAVTQQVNAPPRNADVRLNGAVVDVTTEAFGVQVLVDQTLLDVTAALQSLERQQVALRTRTLVPTIRNEHVTAIAAEARALLAQPLIARVPEAEAYLCTSAGACTWLWTPHQIARWVTLARSPSSSGVPTFELQIDRAAMKRELVPVAETLYHAGGLPRVDWNGGNPVIIQEGTNGRGLDAALTVERMYDALLAQAGDAPREIELPTTTLPPPVIQSNLASLGITDLIGVGVSSFQASQAYRITNIQAGAQRMHGILLAPGDVFSFNNNLGAVDASNGFVQGAAIVQNRTQMEWGGGLCQVSTTVFRAAFWTGLEIVERHEHTFRIGWYEELGEPPGLDATIFTGVTDLRFRNDTGGYVLLQSYVDLNRQQLTVAVYGDPRYKREVQMGYQILGRTAAPWRPVYVDDPTRPRGYFKQTDWARPGLTVEVYRTVSQQGQVLYQDVFPSVFEPWPNIYVRGIGR